MSDYRPSAYLVRAIFRKEGEPTLGMTMDTSGATDGDVYQQTIRAAVEAVGNVMFRAYGVAEQPEKQVYFEVMLGVTANQIDRWRCLLQDARNALIDCKPNDTINALIDEIGEELE